MVAGEPSPGWDPSRAHVCCSPGVGHDPGSPPWGTGERHLQSWVWGSPGAEEGLIPQKGHRAVSLVLASHTQVTNVGAFPSVPLGQLQE